MKTLECPRCRGKVFVDTTFMENKNYETFCIICGDRKFVGPRHPAYGVIVDSIRNAVL
jgi:transcription elongation factor Elf1